MARKRTSAARHDDDWRAESWYPSERPLPVADGIKAKTTRGAFGTSWWAKRWIAVLGTFGWGTRLQRGRTYARKGQVVRIALAPGVVQAQVQGSRATPYAVTLRIAPLTDAQWTTVIERMAEQAIFAAQLLAGAMPHDIERVFEHAAVPLFPQTASDLVTHCSCPDYANPCKHIAAVYYLMGERFDDDPFLIFELRGRTKAQLLDALQARRIRELASADHGQPVPEPVPALRDLLDEFYAAGPDLRTLHPHIAAPATDAPVLLRYGAPPGDTEHDLRQLYQLLTTHVLEEVFGKEEDGSMSWLKLA